MGKSRGIRQTAIAAALLSLAGVGGPASAKWQATEWNMTPEQVAAAMAGAAPLDKGSRGERLGGKRVGNVGEYRLGESVLRSVYYYDEKGLAQVSLTPRSGKCKEIYEVVAREHGAPLKVSDQLIFRLIIWHDRAAGNRIRLMVSQSACELNYERLSDYESVDLTPRD